MKPYYKNKLTTIYNKPMLDVLKTFKDNEFYLLFTDPPYGIGEHKASSKKRGILTEATEYKDYGWDNSIPTEEEFKEMKRVAKHLIIFGGNYFIEYLDNSPCWIVWDKDNGKNDFADCELAWTNFNSAVRKYKFKWQGMLQEDMKFKEKRYHPTQKPVELFIQILKDYNKEKKKTLDCYSGSFTTSIACEKLGIENVGIEKEKDYCDIGVKRLNNLQMRLDI